jgi:hypothetical protein
MQTPCNINIKNRLRRNINTELSARTERFVNVNKKYILEIVDEVIDSIPKITSIKISVETTYDVSIVFTFINMSKSLYLEMFFESNDKFLGVINIFENKIHIKSVSGAIENLITELKKFYI